LHRSDIENSLNSRELGKYFVRDNQWVNTIKSFASGLTIAYSNENTNIWQTIFAYMPANRNQFTPPTSIEPVDIQGKTIITRNASKEFLKYILNLDYQLYGAQTDGEMTLRSNLEKWFANFQNALREIYDCSELELKRDAKNLAFKICLPGRELFGLHEMSDGYAAFLDIYMELLMRFESAEAIVEYSRPAIVLIDEIETHLHVELQKRVLPFLTTMFPNIQFIVSTHSPFIINSISNSVVFDLENKRRIENLSAYSWETIVESYFETGQYSLEMTKKFGRYKELYHKNRSCEEEKEFFKIRVELETVSPAQKELYNAFRQMELNLDGKAGG
jgi:hypothetical protein